MCQIKLEALMLSVYTQRRPLHLNEAVDKVLVIEVHVIPKKTKTRDTFDALYHYRRGVRDHSYSYYWSSKWPSGSCETPVCKAGMFCIILTLDVMMAPRRLVHDGVSVLQGT